MARPLKTDLDFFPFNVGLFNDDKFDDVQNEYGPLGEVIYLRLLCFIYSNKGYYYEFESLDKVASKIIRSVGNRWVRNKEYVKKIISYLAENNLFSKELMQDNILTSVGIQRRYVYVMEKIYKRKVRITKYNLIEKADKEIGFEFVPENEVNSEETPVNSEETPSLLGDNDTKESKVNEIELNGMRTDKPPAAANCSRDDLIKDYGIAAVNEYERRFEEWKAKQGAVNADKYAQISKWLYEDYRLRKEKNKAAKGENSSFDITAVEKMMRERHKSDE